MQKKREIKEKNFCFSQNMNHDDDDDDDEMNSLQREKNFFFLRPWNLLHCTRTFKMYMVDG